jgi:hypothetical protein
MTRIMITAESLDHTLRVKAILTIVDAPLPDTLYDTLAVRITQTSGVSTSPEMVLEYLEGSRSLGTHERAAFQEIVGAHEKTTGRRL